MCGWYNRKCQFLCIQGMIGRKFFSSHKQTSQSLLSVNRYKYSSDIIIVANVIDIIIIIILIEVERDY